MQNTVEIDDVEFYNKLLDNPPQTANSIQLDLDASNITELFERLIQIFHQATIKFHGDTNDKVDLKTLTVTDFQHINKYFNSFGIEVGYKVGKLDELAKLEKFIKGKNNTFIQDRILNIDDIIDYKHRITDNLKDLRFTIAAQESLYVIWFNYL
tara:strand:- start:174 stop:635 length:462 start_codon:yes stop_codon:yes gene_type:complete